MACTGRDGDDRAATLRWVHDVPERDRYIEGEATYDDFRPMSWTHS